MISVTTFDWNVCLFVWLGFMAYQPIRLFNAKSIFIKIISSVSDNSNLIFSYKKKVLTIQFNISAVFVQTQLDIKTVLFQTIWFSISTQFSSIWLIDMTLSSTTTPGQSRPGNDGNKGVLPFSQSSIRLFSVISRTLVGEILSLCRDAVGVFCSSSWLGHFKKGENLSNYFLEKLSLNKLFTKKNISAVSLFLYFTDQWQGPASCSRCFVF